MQLSPLQLLYAREREREKCAQGGQGVGDDGYGNCAYMEGETYTAVVLSSQRLNHAYQPGW